MTRAQAFAAMMAAGARLDPARAKVLEAARELGRGGKGAAAKVRAAARAMVSAEDAYDAAARAWNATKAVAP